MRKRTITIIFLPAIIFLWIIGWSLYWIGSSERHEKAREARPITDDDGIQVEAVPVYGECEVEAQA